MKKLLLAAAALMAAMACNPNKCVITGQVENLGDGYIYLEDTKNDRAVIDSVEVRGGAFKLAVDASVPTVARFVTDGARVAPVIVERGGVTVTGNLADGSVYAAGTPSNDGLASYTKGMKELRERFSQAKSDEEAEAINDEYEEFIDKLLEDNKENLFGIDLYIGIMGYELSGREMVEYLDAMPEQFRQIGFVREAVEISKKKMLTEPQAEGSDYVPHYIDIDLPTPEGANVSLASVIGNPKSKYVLLDFWASWCGPCMREMPHLKQAYAKYGKKGFQIYGVSLDSRAEDWKKAIAEVGMKWVNVSALTGFKCEAAEEYAVQSIPTNYLIDCSNGVIIAKNLRGDDVLEKLDALFE